MLRVVFREQTAALRHGGRDELLAEDVFVCGEGSEDYVWLEMGRTRTAAAMSALLRRAPRPPSPAASWYMSGAAMAEERVAQRLHGLRAFRWAGIYHF